MHSLKQTLYIPLLVGVLTSAMLTGIALTVFAGDDASKPLRYVDVYGVPGIGKPAEPDADKSAAEAGDSNVKNDAELGGTTNTNKNVSPDGKLEMLDKLTPFLGETKKESKHQVEKGNSKGLKKTKATGRELTLVGLDKKENRQTSETKKVPNRESLVQERVDPLKDILFLMSLKQYKNAKLKVEQFLAANPSNAQAHYLKAVICVMLRQYEEAYSEYNSVLLLAPQSELATRARVGLRNLNQ